VRVIAGSAKGRTLRPPRTSATRPITDRAKESLFSILMPRIADRRFLDLFAGTGSVGIRHNLDVTGLAARAEVVGRDVFGYLREPPAPFDVIFVAPPQWRGLWPRAVALLDREPVWLADGALVVAQHDPSESIPLDLAHLELADERSYGRVRFTFFGARAPA